MQPPSVSSFLSISTLKDTALFVRTLFNSYVPASLSTFYLVMMICSVHADVRVVDPNHQNV